MSVLVQVCIVVISLALVGVAIALMRSLFQLTRTAGQLETTLEHLDRTLPEIAQTIAEARGAAESVARIAGRVDHVVGEFEVVGTRAARASSRLVDEVIEPAGQVVAIARGVRAGASTLFSRLISRRTESPNRLRGGNHDE